MTAMESTVVTHPDESDLADLARPGIVTTAETANAAAQTTEDEIITRPRSACTHSHSSLSVITGIEPPASPHSSHSSNWSFLWSDEMPEPSTSKRRSTRWIARGLPLLMLALVAYATYDIIVYCCGELCLAVLLLIKHLLTIDSPGFHAKKGQDGSRRCSNCIVFYPPPSHGRSLHTMLRNGSIQPWLCAMDSRKGSPRAGA